MTPQLDGLYLQAGSKNKPYFLKLLFLSILSQQQEKQPIQTGIDWFPSQPERTHVPGLSAPGSGQGPRYFPAGRRLTLLSASAIIPHSPLTGFPCGFLKKDTRHWLWVPPLPSRTSFWLIKKFLFPSNCTVIDSRS